MTVSGEARGLIGRIFGDAVGGVPLELEDCWLLTEEGGENTGLTDWGTGEGVESELSEEPQPRLDIFNFAKRSTGEREAP